MFDSLRSYIARYSQTVISDDEFERVKSVLKPKALRKRQYFLREGDVCEYFGFVVKGATRQYTIDEKGVECIVRLCIEDWWVGDRESWINLTPSVYNIDAWEDTQMLLITKADTYRLTSEVPAFAEMLRTMDERHAFAAARRVHASISMSAEKRYQHFISAYPEFLSRFPQHMIASYLGIAKETLSRIRKLR